MSEAAPTSPPNAPAAASSILQGRMPDITPAQLVAIVGAVIAVAVSFGANISREQQEAILGLTAAICAVLFAADAHVRSNRARAEATRHVADTHAATVEKVLVHHAAITKQALDKNVAPPPLVYPAPPAPPSS